MKRVLFLVLFLCFLTTVSFAQRIDTTLAAYADKYQHERMYIQFDKPAYAPGETVWFKAYLMAGILPSAISKNCYTDWYDAAGNLLAHAVFPIVQSSAAGEFIIPDSIPGSAVHMKAYTTWMLNWDTAFLFEKNIPLAQKTSPKTLVKISVTPSLTFFPEGGDAVAGLPSRIAFLAADQYGRPVKIKGVVVNKTGAVVDTLKTEHDGMGGFRLTYDKGETYTAKWTDEQNTAHQTPLPAASTTSSASVEIGMAAGKKTFLIRRTDDAPDNMKTLRIVATMHQQLVYMANANLTQNTSIGGAIPTSELATGVLQITLFSNDWKPMAERVCFVNNNEATFTPEIGFTELGLGKRKKNTINISLPDSVAGNLSLAITDKGIGSDSSNIIAQLLLSGDLRGAVYKPQYYFSNNSDSVVKHLDLVMLTHGWRRFDWEAIVRGDMPKLKYAADDDYLTFSGKIFGANSTQLRSAGNMFALLEAKDSTKQPVSVSIRPDGTFADPNIVLFDSTKIYYQFTNKSFGEMVEVRFMNNVAPSAKHIVLDKSKMVSLDTAGNARLRFLASESARLKEMLKGTTLEGVTVTAKAKSPLQKLDERYASGLFQGSDAYQFDLTNDPVSNAYQSVFTYLQGRVAGLQITGSGSNISMSWRGGSPVVYLNEMETNIDQLANTPVTDIAYVKVFRPPFMGGFNGSNGAIAVYTKKGGDQPVEKGKGMPFKTVIGYTAVKEFYSPNYGVIDPRNEAEDVRSTLYWNPMILTTPNNRSLRFSFYNNDVTDAFRVVLEGMSTDGRLVHIEKVIE